MKFKVKNKSNMDFSQFKPILKSFMSYATREMGFQKPPSLFFVSASVVRNPDDKLRNTVLDVGFAAANVQSLFSFVTKVRRLQDKFASLGSQVVAIQEASSMPDDTVDPRFFSVVAGPVGDKRRGDVEVRFDLKERWTRPKCPSAEFVSGRSPEFG